MGPRSSEGPTSRLPRSPGPKSKGAPTSRGAASADTRASSVDRCMREDAASFSSEQATDTAKPTAQPAAGSTARFGRCRKGLGPAPASSARSRRPPPPVAAAPRRSPTPGRLLSRSPTSDDDESASMHRVFRCGPPGRGRRARRLIAIALTDPTTTEVPQRARPVHRQMPDSPRPSGPPRSPPDAFSWPSRALSSAVSPSAQGLHAFLDRGSPRP